MKCNKCGQLGHMERICKNEQQHREAKSAIDDRQEEQLFTTLCFVSNSSAESWLIDSGCTNHMAYDRELFKGLDKIVISKIIIGDGRYVMAEGKGTIAIEGISDLKLISDVLYVPKIDQNLLSIPQLLEKD